MSSPFKIQNSNARSGISIIEVLTAIVVAMIGVFGIMILIPFAVKQAQSGLDSDAAVILANNAYSDFEVGSYRIPENWAVLRVPTGTVAGYSPFDVVPGVDRDGDGNDDPDPPENFSIDPLGVTENASYTTTVFPFNGVAAGVAYPAALIIRPANLGTPLGLPMTAVNARRMFRTTDDLVFDEPISDLGGPTQIFDQSVNQVPLSRQSNGRLSWSSIVVPYKNNPATLLTERWSYQMFILAYKHRKTLLSDPDGRMVTAQLEPRQNIGYQTLVSNVYLEPGVVIAGNVQRDDWVMLINRTLNEEDDGAPPAGVTYAEKGFDRQVSFYRVVGVSDGVGAPNPNNPATLASLTLDGGAFNFGDPDGINPAVDPDGLIQETYVVHLKDVVGVYQQTFAPEFESTWTN